jgi:hypothetical protein
MLQLSTPDSSDAKTGSSLLVSARPCVHEGFVVLSGFRISLHDILSP